MTTVRRGQSYYEPCLIDGCTHQQLAVGKIPQERLEIVTSYLRHSGWDKPEVHLVDDDISSPWIQYTVIERGKLNLNANPFPAQFCGLVMPDPNSPDHQAPLSITTEVEP